jgi:adenylylsulfate kinase
MIEQKGFTIWLTGLSTTGKSVLADVIEGELLERGLKVEVLDEEAVAPVLDTNSNASRQNIYHNIRKIGFISELLTRNNVITIVSAISPFAELRTEMRNRLKDFLEVYARCKVDKITPVEKSQIPDDQPLTDAEIVSLYEAPENPEVMLDTSTEAPGESAKKVIKALEILKWIPSTDNDNYSSEEEAKIQERLEGLGYI